MVLTYFELNMVLNVVEKISQHLNKKKNASDMYFWAMSICTKFSMTVSYGHTQEEALDPV
jgi:hypothetical protein